MANYTAIFERSEDGWTGYVPDLPTILVSGATLEEATERAREAVAIWMDEAKTDGLEIAEPSTRAVEIEVG